MSLNALFTLVYALEIKKKKITYFFLLLKTTTSLQKTRIKRADDGTKE